MGNQVGAAEDEEYVVCNIAKDDLDRVHKWISEDDIETLQAQLLEITTVDTDAYLEFTDALVSIDENEEVFTLQGKFEAPNKDGDKLEQLMETGYVMTMMEYANKQQSKKILSWLNSMAESEKLEQAAAKLGEIPDFNALTKDFPGTTVESCFIEETNCYELLREEEMVDILLKGGIKFWYDAASTLSVQSKAFVRSIVNLSDFDDEEAENNVPVIDVDDPSEMKKYTFVNSKICVLAPTRRLELLNIDLMVNPDYQQVVQSYGNDRIHIMRRGEKGWEPRNNRTVRAVTRIVGSWNMTVQNQISEYPVEKVNADPILNHGLKWDRAFLSERTKQNIQRKDSTVKFKAVTLLKQLDDAVLMMALTVAVNSLVPAWVVKRGKGPILKAATNVAKGNRAFFAKYPGGLEDMLAKLKKEREE